MKGGCGRSTHVQGNVWRKLGNLFAQPQQVDDGKRVQKVAVLVGQGRLPLLFAVALGGGDFLEMPSGETHPSGKTHPSRKRVPKTGRQLGGERNAGNEVHPELGGRGSEGEVTRRS